MINDIIGGIAKALHAEFGSIPVWAEQQKQGFEEPCFYVYCTEPTSRVFLGKRYFKQHPLCVTYFPSRSNAQREECNDVAQRLFDCLEYIELEDGKIMGTNMKYAISDNVLVFTLNYDTFAYKVEQTEAMDELAQSITAKG